MKPIKQCQRISQCLTWLTATRCTYRAKRTLIFVERVAHKYSSSLTNIGRPKYLKVLYVTFYENIAVKIMWFVVIIFSSFFSCGRFIDLGFLYNTGISLLSEMKFVASYGKARFPLPELTARVNGPSWRVTGFHYPSTRSRVSTSRVDGPCV